MSSVIITSGQGEVLNLDFFGVVRGVENPLLIYRIVSLLLACHNATTVGVTHFGAKLGQGGLQCG